MVEIDGEDRFVFFTDRETRRILDTNRSNVETMVVELDDSPARAASSRGRRSVPDLIRLSRRVADTDLDVIFFPSVYTYFPIPPKLNAVVCVHDVIADRYPSLTLPGWRDRLFWKLKVGLALRQARLILTVSEYSAREIESCFGLSADRIRVASEAPAKVFRPSSSRAQIRETAERYGLPPGADWFLYVGGFNPHKRVDVLVRAHARVADRAKGSIPYLLLVGAVEEDVFHRHDQEIREEIARSGTERRVLWTGFVPDEDLRQLYSGALAVVLPSQAEGFGLPAIEGAACGSPVIATRASPLPDLLSGGGLFVEPGDLDGLTSSLWRLMVDEAQREQLGAVAREKAQQLTWANGARAALDVLREAAA